MSDASRTIRDGQNSARFTVVYDGPAIKDGAMNVRDLAPSLLAMGSLCERANEILNPQGVTAGVRVEARMESGSFDVRLLFDQSILGQIKELFDPGAVHSANEILRLLGIAGIVPGSVSLIRLLKKIRGGNIKDLPHDVQNNVTINIDNSVLVVRPEVLTLAQDSKIRRDVEDLTCPLAREGVSEMRFLQQEQEVETIPKDELAWFQAPPDLSDEQGQPPREQETVYTLEVVTTQFDPKLKWRLQSGGMRMTATMNDEKFLARIEQHEVRFSKGDIMTIRVRATQKLTPQGKPVIENQIVKVLKYVPAPVQLKLPDKAP